jgi:hypothetical protein
MPDAHAGLCTTCAHVDLVRSSRGSTFVLCRLSAQDARFPRYPTLPVVQCSGYRRAAPERPS